MYSLSTTKLNKVGEIGIKIGLPHTPSKGFIVSVVSTTRWYNKWTDVTGSARSNSEANVFERGTINFVIHDIPSEGSLSDDRQVIEG